MAAEDGSAVPTPAGAVDPSASPEPAAAEPVTDAPDLGEMPEATPVEPSDEEKTEAAVREVTETNHKVTYKARDKEVVIQLPPKLPASIKFRISALDDNDPAVLRVVRKLIGDEPWEEVMDAMDGAEMFDSDDGGANVEAETTLASFVNDILRSYGVTPGESPASQKS